MRKPSPGRSLLKSTLVSAACVSAGCASVPPPRPRPSAECPPGHQETLKRFGFERRDWQRLSMIPVDELFKTKIRTLTVQEGPYTTAELPSPWHDIPHRTKLQGELFFEDNRVHGYFNRIVLPTGESLPVCIRLAAEYDRRGVPMLPGSRPGKAVIKMLQFVETASHFAH